LASVVVNVPYGGLFMPPAVAKRLPLKQEEVGWENFRLADPCLLNVVARACEAGTVEGPLGGKEIPRRTLVSYAFSPLVADPLGYLAAELSPGRGGEAEREGSAPGAGGGTGKGTGTAGGEARDGAPGGGAAKARTLPPRAPAIIPRSTGDVPLFGWSDREREIILKKSAVPYLEELRDRCGELLDRGGLVLLVTARSYASAPWDFESDRRYPRPQLGIGTRDGTMTPRGLAEFVGRTFRAFGLWPELDWPHSGAWAPPELASCPRLLCCTVSFRRDLYMDERTGRLSERSEGLSRLLRTVLGLLENQLDEVVRIRYRRRHPPKPPSMIIKASPGPGQGS
jgi:hypothetical protein